MTKKLRLVVMASGRGSNFSAIADAIREGALDAEIAALVCDKPKAPVIDKAMACGNMDIAVLTRKGFASRADYDMALADLVFGFRSRRKFCATHLVELPDLFFKAHAAEECFDSRFDFRCRLL